MWFIATLAIVSQNNQWFHPLEGFPRVDRNPPSSYSFHVVIIRNALNLVTGSARLCDNTLQLIDLRLGASESTQLQFMSVLIHECCFKSLRKGRLITYPLLCELTSALILGVSQEFDNTTLIRGKTVIAILVYYSSRLSTFKHTQKPPSRFRERKRFSC